MFPFSFDHAQQLGLDFDSHEVGGASFGKSLVL
jgi:hypothetical protein